MQSFYESYCYMLLHRLSLWLGRQWTGSYVVAWFTGQSYPQEAPAGRLRRLWCRMFQRLHLNKLLTGSIFLHPAWFAAAAVILAPLVPTVVVMGLVGAALFALALRLGVEESAPLGSSPIHKYVVLYAVVYLYATFTSTSIQGSLFPGMLTVMFVLFFLAVASCRPTWDQLQRVLWGLVAAGTLVALYGFYQRLNPSQFRSVWTDTDMFSSITFRVYSTLENPNMLGVYFLLIIPMGAALTLTTQGLKKRLLAGGATALMLLCLVLTYSRGCYLALIVAGALFLVLLDRRFLVAGIVILALSPLYLPDSVISRFTSIGNMGDTSTSYRVYIWMGTLAMLKDYWFSGIGPGETAFNMVYPNYAYNAITAPHSHNLFLQIICDTGFCGILVFVLLVVGYYRMMFTAIAHTTRRNAKVLQIGAVSAVTGFLVEGLTDYAFYNYRVMLLFWALLGLSVVLWRMGKEEAHP